MVPITDRNNYISDLKKNGKFDLFFSLVYHVDTISTFTVDAEIDKIYVNILNSIRDNNKELFETNFSKLSEREPKKNSPFTNDDLLLFTLIIGVKKFGFNSSWIQTILNIRETPDVEGKLLKITFQNIINGNYRSYDNAFQVVMVFEELLEIECVTTTERKHFYKQITMLPFPFYKSELLNILSLKAYDIIITDNDKSEEGLLFLLKEFDSKFLKRIKLTTYFLQTILSIAIVMFIVKLVSQFSVVKDFIESYNLVLGFLGVGAFSSFIPFLHKIFYKTLLKLLGYPKALINKNIEQS